MTDQRNYDEKNAEDDENDDEITHESQAGDPPDFAENIPQIGLPQLENQPSGAGAVRALRRRPTGSAGALARNEREARTILSSVFSSLAPASDAGEGARAPSWRRPKSPSTNSQEGTRRIQRAASCYHRADRRDRRK